MSVRKLSYGQETMTGFQAYGFQRFMIYMPNRATIHGAQLLGVHDDDVTIVEIRGPERRCWTIPRSQLTYSQKLLRPGAE
jgi:hypothetical protein